MSPRGANTEYLGTVSIDLKKFNTIKNIQILCKNYIENSNGKNERGLYIFFRTIRNDLILFSSILS